MLSQSLLLVLCLAACSLNTLTGLEPREIDPQRSGALITESVRIAPGVYELPDSNDRGVVIISGDDLVVDFQGATLVGSVDTAEADAYGGRGIVVRGRNVTVKNANVRGYKVAVYAEDSPGLTITGCDVSRNYRQRLKSTIEHEDLSDWIYGHDNDENEWLRYGAGIYLLRCPDATIVNCRARNGQNGICISRCDRARIADNDMSFMSGWGLAMWRSSNCEIFNNKFDWCMRGYSHGVYSRGQDSTGILVYEQCHNNLFAYNSATHGGDGFFLYAGNETVNKTGQGGCNGNILYRNDFSHAAANGIEATFSSGNVFVENILDECTHGVWAGYSFNTIIEGNTIRRCTNGISIEHGWNNQITGNIVADTELGVHLWWDDDADLLASPFGKAHPRCPSESNIVAASPFERVKTAVRLVDDTNSLVAGNTMSAVATSVHLRGNVDGLRLGVNGEQRATLKNEGRGSVAIESVLPIDYKPLDILAREPRLATRRGNQDAFLPPNAKRGREFIFVDEWGPYDFTDARVFPAKVLGGSRSTIQVLGPASDFRVSNVVGSVKVTPMAGLLPGKLIIEATEPGVHTFAVDIEAAGRTLHAQGVLLNAAWHVRFYGWSESGDPRSGAEAWSRIVAGPPFDEATVQDVDFAWQWRGPSEKVPKDHFATVATTTVNLPAGAWRMQTVSDDGVRVFVDGREVLGNWTHHGPTVDEARVELESGGHEIRIEHFEIDGYAQLQFRLEPVR